MKAIVTFDDMAQGDFRLTFSNVRFGFYPDGKGDVGHISRTKEGVDIQDLTLFPASFTYWDGIKWGLRGIFHMSPPKSRKKEK